MDETTQQNAAVVEEAAAAAASMQDQAANLARVVSVFKLDASRTPAHHAQAVSSVRPAAALTPQATPRLPARKPAESDFEEF
jgi:methyl-accepting chemotaxis protein